MSEENLPNFDSLAYRLDHALIAHRVVQFGLAVALMWKWEFFRWASSVYGELPLSDSFFPAWLQSVWVLRVVFMGTVAAIVLSIFAMRTIRIVCAVISLVGCTILCWHQGSYNDMTFVTAWWTALWTMWYVFRMDDADTHSLMKRAAFLSRIIISMILLGGAAGKWTSEYWSGDVLYDIYFVDRDFWVFNFLRDSYEPQALRNIATWYSRQVVLTETIAGVGLWLLPAKWAALVGVVLLTSIAVFSNFLLFSVLMSLIGLAAVGFLVPKPQKPA